jgi:hypothetical protein
MVACRCKAREQQLVAIFDQKKMEQRLRLAAHMHCNMPTDLQLANKLETQHEIFRSNCWPFFSRRYYSIYSAHLKAIDMLMRHPHPS